MFWGKPQAKQSPNVEVKTGLFEGVIFSADHEAAFLADKNSRWTPTKEDIIEAENIVHQFLQKNAEKTFEEIYNKVKQYPAYRDKELPKERVYYKMDNNKRVLEKLAKSKRQYVGYLDQNRQKIIWINFFPATMPNWKEKIVYVDGGGAQFFNIKVNMETKTCFELMVNAII